MWRGLVLVLLLSSATPVLPQSNCNSFLYDANGGDSIGVTCDQNVLNCASAVSGAAGMWNGCAEAGVGFPEIVGNGSGALSLTVEIRDVNSTVSGGGCGFLNPVLEGNRLTGDHIVIFARRSDGSSCAPPEAGPIQRYGIVELLLDYSIDRNADASGNYHFLRGTCVRRLPGYIFETRALEDVFFRRAP